MLSSRSHRIEKGFKLGTLRSQTTRSAILVTVIRCVSSVQKMPRGLDKKYQAHHNDTTWSRQKAITVLTSERCQQRL